jgi:hypothetical protein
MRILRWIADRLKDIFYDATNAHLDIGRCLGYVFALSIIGAAVWNMHLGKEIDLAAFGGALTAVLGGLQFYIHMDRKLNAN